MADFNWGDFMSSPQFWMGVVPSLVSKLQNPKGYTNVQTPQDKQLFNAKMGLFNDSSYRNYVTGVAQQAMKGIAGFNPNFQFASNALKGQKPMNGMNPFSGFDFSSLPALTSPGQSQPAAPGGPPGNFGGNPSGPTGVPGAPFGSPASPAGGPGDPFANMPTGGGPGNPGGGDITGIYTKAVNYLHDNPSLTGNLLKGGGTALFAALGLPALAGSVLGQALFTALQKHFGGGDQQLPIDNKQYPIDILKPGGTAPPDARTDITPNQGPGYGSFWNWMDQNLRDGGPGGGAGDPSSSDGPQLRGRGMN